MVPYADQINHENVCVNYDCLDQVTGEVLLTAEEKNEKARKEVEKKEEDKKKFLSGLKDDLEQLSAKVEGYPRPSEENTWRIGQAKKKFEENIANKAILDEKDIDQKTDKLKHDLQAEKDNQEQGEYSSGLESDHDVDLLVEQEVIKALKMRKELRRMVSMNEEKKVADKHHDDD